MKFKRILTIILVVISCFAIFSGCGDKKTFSSIEEFNDATLGVAEGSIYRGYCESNFPDATINEQKTFADVFMSLKLGKIDGCLLDQPNFNALTWAEENSGAKSIVVPDYGVDVGYGFQLDDTTLHVQMDELLSELRTSGEMDALLDKWYGETEPTAELVKPNFSGNTVIKVAIDQTRKPFVYMRNGEPYGFEIEVLYKFCERYNYNPQMENTTFSNGLAGLDKNSRTYDMVAGGLYITPARAEKVTFSQYMQADVVMVTYDGDSMGSFSDGFRRTFIEEGRWKLILEGVCTTLIITFASAIIGTLLGFGIYMLCRTFGKVAKVITKIFTVIMNGTPIVVILMVLYYVVFGRLDISGLIVAIIGFSLTTAAFVYEKLTVAVNSIDVGQSEAAMAMGFSKNKSFFSVILPQALKFFMPIYQGEMVSLVKATAIVGYVAVEDLTKMADIIRCNTFEAFFPLIASALIYLLLSFGISMLVKLIIKLLEPKNRSQKRIMRGIKK